MQSFAFASSPKEKSIVSGLSLSDIKRIVKQMRIDPSMTWRSITPTGLTLGQILRLHENASYHNQRKRKLKFQANRSSKDT
jgi:hypothetical protein